MDILVNFGKFPFSFVLWGCVLHLKQPLLLFDALKCCLWWRHPFLYTANLPKLTFFLFQISRNFSASGSFMGPLVAQVVKNLPAMQETQVWSLGQEVPLQKINSNLSPVFLPEEFHGQRNLAGCSLWGHKESDTTEQLSL